MAFLTYKLIFAVVALFAVVAIALVRRKRQTRRLEVKTTESTPEAIPGEDEATPSTLNSLTFGMRKAPEVVELQPSPEAETTPTARRRQLRPLSEIEQEDAVHALVVMPPLLTEEPHENEGADEAAQEIAPLALPEAATPDAATLSSEPLTDLCPTLLARLETLFDQYQSGEITLDAYCSAVRAEQPAIQQRIASLGADGAEDKITDALSAQDAVHWCLDWAQDQALPKSA